MPFIDIVNNFEEEKSVSNYNNDENEVDKKFSDNSNSDNNDDKKGDKYNNILQLNSLLLKNYRKNYHINLFINLVFIIIFMKKIILDYYILNISIY